MDSFGDLPEAFSHWSFATDDAAAELSFALGGETPEPPVSLWRMDFPSDPQAAAGQLDRFETQVASAQAALKSIPARLQHLAAWQQASGELSFDAAATPLPDPELQLLRWLQGTDPSGVHFGTVTIPSGELKAAGEGLQRATQNVLRMLTHLAWVETGQAGRLLARTAVRWTGDQDTAWQRGVTAQQHALHQRSLRLAIASRLALLRLLIVVTQGATKLSVLITTPGAAFLALPAAWKFTNYVLAEAEELKAI